MKDSKNDLEETEGYYCSECGADVSMDEQVCPQCGADISELEEDEAEEVAKEASSTRYPSLRTIAALYKILAVLLLIAAVLELAFALHFLFEDSSDSLGYTLLIISILTGTIGVITLFAYAESITLFIDIANNSTMTIQAINKMAQAVDGLKTSLLDQLKETSRKRSADSKISDRTDPLK